ncbi:septum formation initiator family protein [Candidatus Microgenomates bacterium]|nr:septum formation initiator family protein [Candidatus Microgenomates bacterium]
MRKIIAIIIFAFEAYLIITLSRSVWELWGKRDEYSKIQEKVAQLKEENNRRQSEARYVQTPQFIEKEAREKLNLVKPDETLVIIPQNVLKEATAAASPAPILAPWQQWLKLFF